MSCRTMANERWLPISGWPYEVSDLGRVRRTGGKIISTYPNKDGHHLFGLHDGGKRLTTAVHKHVLTAFVGPRPPGMVGCHGDGNPANNALSNLRWDTYKANEADKIRHGTSVRGSRVHLAKLTDDAAIEIRAHSASGVSGAALAKTYGVSPNCVSRIILRRTWKHV